MEDRDIVALFLKRDERAIRESKNKYESYCLYVARNLLHDESDSEEVLNDALLAAWNSIPPHNPSNLKTYLGKLSRDLSVDRLRERCAQKRVPAESLAPLDELEEVIGDGQTDETAEENELSRLVSAFLRSLGEDERKVFVRRYWYFDPVKKICERYGFGQSKVLVTLKRTRDKLAVYLKKEGYLK